MNRCSEAQARADAKAKADEEKTRPLRLAHAWMTVQALRLLESRGVELSAEDARAVVDYVYEQVLADVINLASGFKRSVLLHDVLLLEAIIRLGRAPEKDPTPMPELAA
jgi:hypothetical protein